MEEILDLINKNWNFIVGILIFIVLLFFLSLSNINYSLLLWIFFWLSLFLLTSSIEKNFISPIWIVFLCYLTYCGLRPGYLIFYKIDPFLFNIFPVDSSIYLTTFYLIISSYIPICLGYLFSNYIKFQSPIQKSTSISEGFLVLSTIFFQAFVVISAFIIIINFGGLNQIISLQSSLVLLIPESALIVRLAWIFILISFIPSTLMLIRFGYDWRVLALLLINTTIGLIFGRRLAILSIGMPIIVYHYYYIKSFTPFKGIIYYFLSLIFLVSIVAIRISNSSLAGISIIEESGEFFIWDMIMSIVNSYGVDTDFRMGADFLPKWIQLYFSIDGGLAINESMGQSLVSIYYPFYAAGVPPSFIGILFMQGGYSILAILSFLYGIFLKIIHNHFKERIFNKIYFLILYPFLLISIFHFTRLGDFWPTIIAQSRIFLSIFLIFTLINNVRIEKKYS